MVAKILEWHVGISAAADVLRKVNSFQGVPDVLERPRFALSDCKRIIRYPAGRRRSMKRPARPYLSKYNASRIYRRFFCLTNRSVCAKRPIRPVVIAHVDRKRFPARNFKNIVHSRHFPTFRYWPSLRFRQLIGEKAGQRFRQPGFLAAHFRSYRAEVDEPVVEDGPRHRLESFVHAPVEFDLVVKRAQNFSDGALFGERGKIDGQSFNIDGIDRGVGSLTLFCYGLKILDGLVPRKEPVYEIRESNAFSAS